MARHQLCPDDVAKHKLKGRVESLNVFMREGERERDFLTDSSIASASTHLRVAKCGLRDEWFSLPGRCCAITPGVRERAGPHAVKQKCRRPWARPVVCFYQSCVRQLHPAKSLPLPPSDRWDAHVLLELPHCISRLPAGNAVSRTTACPGTEQHV